MPISASDPFFDPLNNAGYAGTVQPLVGLINAGGDVPANVPLQQVQAFLGAPGNRIVLSTTKDTSMVFNPATGAFDFTINTASLNASSNQLNWLAEAFAHEIQHWIDRNFFSAASSVFDAIQNEGVSEARSHANTIIWREKILQSNGYDIGFTSNISGGDESVKLMTDIYHLQPTGTTQEQMVTAISAVSSTFSLNSIAGDLAGNVTTYAEEAVKNFYGASPVPPGSMPVAGSVTAVDANGDGRGDWIQFTATSGGVVTMQNSGPNNAWVTSSNTFVVLSDSASSTWTIGAGGATTVVVNHVVDGQTVTYTFSGEHPNAVMTVTDILVQGQPAASLEAAKILVNEEGVQPQTFLTQTPTALPNTITTLLLEAYDSALPSNQTTGAVVNDFTLNVNPNTTTGTDGQQSGASDLDAESNSVLAGVVQSGGGYVVDYGDVNALNNNTADNTAAAAETQILADDNRPGNENLTSEVISDDSLSLWESASTGTNLLGATLNTGDALAQVRAPTKPSARTPTAPIPRAWLPCLLTQTLRRTWSKGSAKWRFWVQVRPRAAAARLGRPIRVEALRTQ